MYPWSFHELLPLFVHGISAAVFVCRLSDRLDGYPADEYYKDGKLVGSALSTQLTTEDQIKCLIRSLLSRSTKLALPKIIIVGTHLDKIEECSESLDEKNRKLLEMLGLEFREQLVSYKRNRLIFPVLLRCHSALVSILPRLSTFRGLLLPGGPSHEALQLVHPA